MYQRKLNLPKNILRKEKNMSPKKNDVLSLIGTRKQQRVDATISGVGVTSRLRRSTSISINSTSSKRKRSIDKSQQEDKLPTLICLQDNVYCLRVCCGIRSPLKKFKVLIEYFRRREDTGKNGSTPSISFNRELYATFVITGTTSFLFSLTVNYFVLPLLLVL